MTESIVMENGAATHDVLHALKTLGVHLAIDDFGTGYSSLSYLKRLPVDVLKVDKSFVDGLGADTEDTAIVRAIVSLAHTLNLDVTGEGIETAAQCHDLEALGCNHGQGYCQATARRRDHRVVGGCTGAPRRARWSCVALLFPASHAILAARWIPNNRSMFKRS
jgi:EAL domain-containing protein (putative c-di-GMP-specific phosphodiesterase class I)